jgi:hypothetical protein
MTMRHWINLLEATGIPTVTDALIATILAQPAMGDFETPEGLEDPNESVETYLGHAVAGIIDEITMGIIGNRLRIYRAIDVDDIARLNTKHLGIYWTTTFNMAIPYNSMNGSAPWLVIEAMVALQHIDWISTIVYHLQGGEDEVRLDDGVPVKVIGARWVSHNGTTKDQSVNRLLGRTLRT